jgi:hypothetical protein
MPEPPWPYLTEQGQNAKVLNLTCQLPNSEIRQTTEYRIPQAMAAEIDAMRVVAWLAVASS